MQTIEGRYPFESIPGRNVLQIARCQSGIRGVPSSRRIGCLVPRRIISQALVPRLAPGADRPTFRTKPGFSRESRHRIYPVQYDLVTCNGDGQMCSQQRVIQIRVKGAKLTEEGKMNTFCGCNSSPVLSGTKRFTSRTVGVGLRLRFFATIGYHGTSLGLIVSLRLLSHTPQSLGTFPAEPASESSSQDIDDKWVLYCHFYVRFG